MKIAIGEIRSDFGGYSRLAKLAADSAELWFDNLELDFSGCTWFDANMSAPLGVVLAHVTDRLNEVKIQSLRSDVEAILAKNRFLVGYGYAPRVDAYGSTIPYRRIKPEDNRYFTAYVNQHLRRNELPKMSEALSRRFKDSVLEVFVNAAMHSETTLGIFACGQYFHKTHRLDFSVADAGIGIRRKIAKELGRRMNSDKAIEWALEKGHTTRKGNVPGGLGLKLLREFVSLNKGRIQIVSDRGYWELNAGQEILKRMDHSFPGTVVNIEINTADTSSYRLRSETGN
ncbi:MAG: ATP-binding protein [Pseudomonadota bacterium]